MFDYNWCWLFFLCKMFLSFLIDVYVIFLYWNILIKCTYFIFDWCLCDFLILKHINEVYALHLHLSFTDVYIFLCRKCSIISILFLIIYWYWLFFLCKMFSSFLIDVCDFLVLKHIDEVHTLHLHLSLTDVEISVCGKYSNISVVCLIINWCWLFFLCKMFLSFSTDVYVIFLYWNISMKCMHFIFICHWLMFTYFCVENVPEFQYCFWLFTDVDYFSCANCSHHFRLMSMWFSCTETHQWSVHTSSSFVIDWCWHFYLWKIF